MKIGPNRKSRLKTSMSAGIINLEAAKALGLTIPLSLLARAGQVIEQQTS